MSWDERFQEFRDRVRDALNNQRLRTALDRATETIYAARKRALSRLPYYSYIEKRAREIKTWSIEHLPELIQSTKEAVEELGGVFYLAKDAKDLNEYVAKICEQHDAKLVVKSKSMTTEETFLNDALEQRGIEVVETDLGEFLIQLKKEAPSHIVVPAVHMPKEEIAELLSRLTGKSLPPDAEKLTRAVREILREKYIKAEVGITGANAISADFGTIFLVTNEGNGRFVSTAPPVHICVAGVEKLVPTVADGLTICQAVCPNATGQLLTSYISLITGPSRTADIELTTVVGVHGPRELYMVLLDNGRMKMAKDPDFKQALYCIKCGACINICPVYREVGGHIMGYRYVGEIGAVLTYFYHGLEKAATFAYTCTECGACNHVCPMGIDIVGMVEKLRERIVKAGMTPPPLRELPSNVEKYKNPFGEPPEKRTAWMTES